MITFRSLTWKNLLSTGNQPTTVRLDASPTTLILGTNGSGKSTFLDALCYVLFKKPFRKIKKDQIVNTINKADCVVEVEFTVGTHEYVVRRGIKPDFFEIVKDGDIRQKAAGQKDDQAHLEEDILKVNYESFTQVVILGNASYTPFMQLPTPKRRDFIEHILDIGVFSQMNAILKTKQSGVTASLTSVTKELDLQKEKHALVQSFIDKLEAEKRKVTENTQDEIDKHNSIIDARTPLIEELEATINEINRKMAAASSEITDESDVVIKEKVAALDAQVEELESQIVDYTALENKLRVQATNRGAIEKNLTQATEAASFYIDNDSCKTCKQPIVEDFKTEILGEKQAKIDEYNKALVNLDLKSAGLQQQIADHRTSNRSLEDQIRKLKNDHTNEVRKLMQEAQDKIKLVTSKLRTQLTVETEALREHQSVLSGSRQLVRRLEADMKAAQQSQNLEEQYKKRSEIESKVVKKEAEKSDAIELRHFYEVAAVLLKDTGIKAAIIKQYLPMINKLVNKYLTELDFFLSFALDENFDETFKSRHRDTLQYHSFSEGEKLRIDLALLFAWRDIARMKNSCSTNLLILDEVIDGSMDNNGTEFFIKMINELGEGSNVFVISHKQDSSLDKFRTILRFVKDKNFSKLAESN